MSSDDESNDSDNEMSDRRRRRYYRYPDLERRRPVRVAENADSEDRDSSSPFTVSQPQSSASSSSIESDNSMGSLLSQLSHLIEQATATLATQYNSSEPEELLCHILDLNPIDPTRQDAKLDEASGSQQPMSTAVNTLPQDQGSQAKFSNFFICRYCPPDVVSPSKPGSAIKV